MMMPSTAETQRRLRSSTVTQNDQDQAHGSELGGARHQQPSEVDGVPIDRGEPRDMSSDDVNDGTFEPKDAPPTKKKRLRLTNTAGKRGRPNKADEQKSPSKRTRHGKDDDRTPIAKNQPQQPSGAEVQQFELSTQALLKKFSDDQAQLQSLKAEVRSLKAKLKETSKAMEQQTITIEGLEAKHEDLQKMVILLKGKNEQAQHTITSGQSRIAELLYEARKGNFDHLKVDDSTIDSLWRQLFFNIKNLVSRSLQSAPAQTVEGFRTPGSEALFQKCVHRPQFKHFYLQHYIWKFLEVVIFRNQQGVWAGSLGQSFTALCNELTAALKEGTEQKPWFEQFSLNKSQMAVKIDDVYGIDQVAAKTVAEALERDMIPFMIPNATLVFRNDLQGVIGIAVKLHVIFMKSRAFFSLVLPAYNSNQGLAEPDTEEMEILLRDANTPASGLAVHIVVSPVLEKLGNADGECFDVRSVVCKARYVAKASYVASAEDELSRITTRTEQSFQVKERPRAAEEGGNRQRTAPPSDLPYKQQPAVKKVVRGQSLETHGSTSSHSNSLHTLPQSFQHQGRYDLANGQENDELSTVPCEGSDFGDSTSESSSSSTILHSGTA
ncbi:hypothetical protein HJFPF1_03105 [Paramyrothecium foliicola]|nr:hypothetical protein HJFPF1_03105 [Paramyrothecium foliicola]